MSAKRAALLTVAMLVTMVLAAAGINASVAGNGDITSDGYGISARHAQ